MGFRKVLFFGALVVLAVAGTARAQVGVYGMYNGSSVTGVTCLAASGSCSSPDGTVRPYGGFGGIYYDFKDVGPVRLGVDFRAGALHANRSASSSAGGQDVVGEQTYLGGLRGSMKLPVRWFVPYAQISAGFTRSDVTEPPCVTTTGSTLLCAGAVSLPTPRQYDSFLQYEFFLGGDVHIFPFMDLRPVELGIGGMSRVGSGNGAGSLGVKSIAAGLVFHLSR